MKLTDEQIQRVKKDFREAQSKEDLLDVLNLVKGYMLGAAMHPFEMKQLNYYIVNESQVKSNLFNLEGEMVPLKRYHSFSIKKKSGKDRVIHAPVKGLKMLQTCLNIILQAVYQPHEAATGFVSGKSIVDNAKQHVGKPYVYNIDLQDFFPSIDQARVWGRLQHPPFNLKGEGRLRIANIVAALCCTEMEVERKVDNKEKIVGLTEEGTYKKIKTKVLPQGAPTSPTVTNIICDRLDRRLTGLAKRFKLRYTRYADDITFSSHTDVFRKDGEFLLELHRIITSQNFRIKESKTRLQKRGYRQEVTGITVNEKVNAPKRYIKQLRRWINAWEKLGYEVAEQKFRSEYTADRGQVKMLQSGTSTEPNMGNVLSGKLMYLKMVRGADNALCLKLEERLKKLTGETTVNQQMKQRKFGRIEKIEHIVRTRRILEEEIKKIESNEIASVPRELNIAETLKTIYEQSEISLSEAMEKYLTNQQDEI